MFSCVMMLCFSKKKLRRNKMFESMVEKKLRNSKLNQIPENDVDVHDG